MLLRTHAYRELQPVLPPESQFPPMAPGCLTILELQLLSTKAPEETSLVSDF